MPTPTALREALIANLSTLGSDMSLFAWEPTTGHPPLAYVSGPQIEYDLTFGRGDDEWTFTVVVMLASTAAIEAQMELDRFMDSGGADSIKTLLESDKTLGGACEDLRVTSCSGPRMYSMDSPTGSLTPPALGCEWTVQVIA